MMSKRDSPAPSVQEDIIRSLKMVEDRLFTAAHPFNRANLFYEVMAFFYLLLHS